MFVEDTVISLMNVLSIFVKNQGALVALTYIWIQYHAACISMVLQYNLKSGKTIFRLFSLLFITT